MDSQNTEDGSRVLHLHAVFTVANVVWGLVHVDANRNRNEEEPGISKKTVLSTEPKTFSTCVCGSHTIRPLSPATLSSGRPRGRCWADPPDSPWWRNRGRICAWHGHPWGSQPGYDFLLQPPGLLEVRRNLPLGIPAPLHCWWSLQPFPWSWGLRHLNRKKEPSYGVSGWRSKWGDWIFNSLP